MSLKFTQSFEATPWAREFVRCVKRNPKIATDVDCMRGWFANAIMRGWDEHARLYPALTALVDVAQKTPVAELRHRAERARRSSRSMRKP